METNPFDWQFLNEPLYKWFIFTIAMFFFLVAWAAIVAEMK